MFLAGSARLSRSCGVRPLFKCLWLSSGHASGVRSGWQVTKVDRMFPRRHVGGSEVRIADSPMADRAIEARAVTSCFWQDRRDYRVLAASDPRSYVFC